MKEVIRNTLARMSDKKLTVWYGSGISRNSGIPIVNSFIDYLLTKMNIDKEDIKVIIGEKMALPFELFMDFLNEQKMHNIHELLKVFDGSHPNSNHFFISSLIESKLTERVYTTNFDELMEIALNEQGINYNLIDYTSEDIASNSYIPIHKIHGTISNVENIAARLTAIAKGELKNRIELSVSELLTNHKHNLILVLGYSFSDFMDVNIALQEIPEADPYFIIVDHIHEGEKISLLDLSAHPVLKNHNGIILRVNTDEFVKEFSIALGLSADAKREQEKSNWEFLIDKWADEQKTKYPLEFYNWISATVFNHIKRLDLSEKYLKICIDNEKDPKNKAQAFGNLSSLYLHNKRFDDVTRILDENIVVFQYEPRAYTHALINYGLINLGLFDSTLDKKYLKISWEKFHEALKIAEDVGSTKNILGIKYNICRILRRLGDKSLLGEVNLLIEKAEQEGLPDIQVRALNVKGMYYFDNKNKDEATKWCQKSLEIAEKINYVDGIDKAKDSIELIRKEL